MTDKTDIAALRDLAERIKAAMASCVESFCMEVADSIENEIGRELTEQEHQQISETASGLLVAQDQLEAERQQREAAEAELAAFRGEQEPVAYMTSDKRMIIFADSTNMLTEDRSGLTPLFTISKTPTPSECLSCDRHYVDGLKHGWNLRDSDNNQGFIGAIERVQKDIRDASSEAAGIVVKDGEF